MSKKPNLIFIFTDEQAQKTMKAYGNKSIHTPNMDRLASQSIVFENAYVTQPVCTPSRSSIMTGLYPHRNGCVENNLHLPEDIPCLPELGDFDGYKKAYIGKWHLGDEIFRQHGFDEWVSVEDEYRDWYSGKRDRYEHCDYVKFLMENGIKHNLTYKDGFKKYSRDYCTRLPEELGKPAFIAREACRFIKENSQQPFILYVNFLEPHMPFFGPRDDQYDRTEIPLPDNFYHELTRDVPLRARLMREAYYEMGFEGKPLKTEEDWKDLIARYWGLVSLVDTHLGNILDAIDEEGLMENSILVYTSDHGDMMGSHRLLTKGVMFEEAVKVPLLLRIPGMTKEDERIANPVSQIDLVPTLLEAMGQEVPTGLDGYSWMPFLTGKGKLIEENVFIEWNQEGDTNLKDGLEEKGEKKSYNKELVLEEATRSPDDNIRTVITPDGWKYNQGQSGDEELYHLIADPGECRNLAKDPDKQDIVRELRQKIIDWQARTKDVVKFF